MSASSVVSHALVEALDVLAGAGRPVPTSSCSVGGERPTIHHQTAEKLVRGGMATFDDRGYHSITADGAVVLRVAKRMVQP